MKRKKEINIQLIPIYIPDAEFQEKKAEIQNLIARMIVSVYEDVDDKKTNHSGVRASHAENDNASLSQILKEK
jgi:hypothetical protein